MTGRGIDQILWHPNSPELHEPFVRDAREYVALAEQVTGPIPRPVDRAYIWGDSLAELERVAAHARIVNLETSITSSSDYCREKGIHYRMHPEHGECLTVARLDVCVLANNHVLDYGRAGLAETLRTLRALGIKTAGAGESLTEAEEPAVVELPGDQRVVVFSLGARSAGVAADWAATAKRSGVDVLGDLSNAAAARLLDRVARVARAGDVVIVSLHWGDNWGYEVSAAKVRFAHRLLDAGVAIVHGHSSHHPRPIEIYRNKLILYGCGDFITDYEGIRGYEQFRGDLSLMYFATVDVDTGELLALRMTPMRMRRLQSTRASVADAEWLGATLTRTSARFGGRAVLLARGMPELTWVDATRHSLNK
jgi:poly-gamma-glutamate synthesis protein (capsule biosynthesis protein)